MLRTRTILILAFGSLITLVALAGFNASRRSEQIYQALIRARQSFSQTENALAEIQADVYLSNIYVRDYLLDPSHITGQRYRDSLVNIREKLAREIDGLDRMSIEEPGTRQRLRKEIDAYWDSLDPLFEWTPRQKLTLSSFFLRDRVLPRRDAVLSIARDIGDLNERTLHRQEQEIEQRQKQYGSELQTTFLIAISLCVLVAGATILYITILERRAESGRRRTEQAEREMRRLSQQLVEAQEDERRSLSRELHDEVGQMLTALRLDLGTLERSNRDPGGQYAAVLDDAKSLAEKTLQAVRSLAMGLRPSMLDDLGLAPAIDWQAREFSRRSGVPVSVEMDGSLGNLPDPQRTCVYRVVQEALTNCARHAKAKAIRILLHGRKGWLSLTIQDDGIGFTPDAIRGRGLGLIGLEERVRKLGGKLDIHSQPMKGTALSVELPL